MVILHSRNVAGVIFALALLSLLAWAQPYDKNPKLESILWEMITANNPEEFALSHNLYIQDGKVKVVIELTNETALLPDYVVEENRYKKNIQAIVPIEKLAELSYETNVTFIRAPLKPYAATPNATNISTPYQTPRTSGFNTIVPSILSIILIVIIWKIWGENNVKK